MSEKQETPKVEKPAGETDTQELGTEAKPSTPDPENQTQDEGKVKDSSDIAAQLEVEQKARRKAEMRANQLENERKEEDIARLKETENYKALAEKLEAEKKEREAEDQAKTDRQAAIDFRDKVISEYPESVQKAAKRLIEKNPSNLLWKDAQDWDDADTQLREQLDSLKESFGDGEEEEDNKPSGPKSRVNANNPAPNLGGVDLEPLAADEMRKILPKSDRDY